MNTNLIYASVLGAFCALTACSEAPSNADAMEQKVDNAMEDLRAGKDDMSRELRDLREDLAVELTKAEERLKDPGSGLRPSGCRETTPACSRGSGRRFAVWRAG